MQTIRIYENKGFSMPDPSAAELSALESLLALSGELLALGGPVIITLLLLSLVAATIVLAKLWQFLWLRPEAAARAEAALQHWYRGDRGEALARLAGSSLPVAVVTRTAWWGWRGAIPTRPRCARRCGGWRWGNWISYAVICGPWRSSPP